MAMTQTAAKNLAKQLRAKFGVSISQANRAISKHWMLLACADVLDWRSVDLRLDTYSGSDENCVRILHGDGLIATLSFPAGSLPETQLQAAWREYEDYLAASPTHEWGGSHQGREAAAATAFTVAYHAYADDGAGNISYTDAPAQTTGWNAYARTEPDEGGIFEIVEEIDVVTEAEAAAAAHRLALKYDADIIERY